MVDAAHHQAVLAAFAEVESGVCGERVDALTDAQLVEWKPLNVEDGEQEKHGPILHWAAKQPWQRRRRRRRRQRRRRGRRRRRRRRRSTGRRGRGLCGDAAPGAIAAEALELVAVESAVPRRARPGAAKFVARGRGGHRVVVAHDGRGGEARE